MNNLEHVVTTTGKEIPRSAANKMNRFYATIVWKKRIRTATNNTRPCGWEGRHRIVIIYDIWHLEQEDVGTVGNNQDFIKSYCNKY